MFDARDWEFDAESKSPFGAPASERTNGMGPTRATVIRLTTNVNIVKMGTLGTIFEICSLHPYAMCRRSKIGK